MIVVSNTTPLIYLAAIGRFNLLLDLYGRIHIPSAVYDEVVSQGAGRWGAAETATANWIELHAMADVASVAALQDRLHAGESEAVVLAQELHADLALVDDLAARHELKNRSIGFVGSVGVLMTAKSRGLISSLKPELEKLLNCGFRLSDQVIRTCLSAVGE